MLRSTYFCCNNISSYIFGVNNLNKGLIYNLYDMLAYSHDVYLSVKELIN